MDPPVTRISFRYFQHGVRDVAWGLPGPPLFSNTEHGDYDAVVDNVVLTVQDNCPEGDLNHDCSQNFLDYSLLAANWMVCDEPNALNCP